MPPPDSVLAQEVVPATPGNSKRAKRTSLGLPEQVKYL